MIKVQLSMDIAQGNLIKCCQHNKNAQRKKYLSSFTLD